MKKNVKLIGPIFLIAFIIAASILAGCGSGGGSGSDSSVSGASANTGMVALSLTDWPTDDYDSIIIYIRRAFLLPADGGSPVLVFDSKDPDGYPVDLLDLKDSEDEFLLTIKKRVPAKRYSKIRLEIVDIEVTGDGGCAAPPQTIKLPSDKIDLTPRNGTFWLHKGETIAIKLDVDAQKSFDLHAAGKSGKCIFRPVVFVDIAVLEQPDQRCPLILAGEIAELLKQDTANPDNVSGFNMFLKERWYADPYDDRGEIEVKFNAETKIFDKDGAPILPNDLENPAIAQVPGQSVLVRGRLIQPGQIDASLVVLGAVDMRKGVVAAPSNEDGFKLDLAHDMGVLDVDLTGAPLILTDCDTPFEGTVIPVGSKVRVFGKYVSENGTDSFRAVVVLVKKQNLTGNLEKVEAFTGGYQLYLEGYLDPIFLPADAPVSIKGINDSEVDILQLQKWVDCKSRKVEIIASNSVPNQADALLILQETLVTTVKDADPSNSTISYTENGLDKKILLVEGAQIFRFMEGRYNNPDYLDPAVDLADIQPGDSIIVYGLEACPDDVAGIGLIDFYAYSVFVWPDEDYKWEYYDGNYYADDDGHSKDNNEKKDKKKNT